MPADLQASAFFVDGVALAASDVELAHDGAGLWPGLAEEIGVVTADGMSGGEISGGLVRPFTLSTMYAVRGDTHDAVWAGIVALRRRCKPGRTVTLTRQMPDPDGTDANTSHTATARRQTDRVQWLGATEATIDIDWLISEGGWRGASTSIGAVGAVTVNGDASTRWITSTLAPGAVNPVVTNMGNGYTFRYIGTVPAGGVLVDVATRHATRLSDSANVSTLLRWSQDAVFQFDPGAQTLTISSGSASFTYYPAYL